MQQAGSFLQEDYFDLRGGLNNSDSPFKVDPSRATGGRNWEYIRTGAVKKRLGPDQLNDSADTSLYTSGLHERNTAGGTINLIRTADRKIQTATLAGVFTNLTEDTTTASSDILAASNVVQTSSAMFTTTSTDVLWLAGGGMSGVYGAYSSTKVTKNGVPEPTGTVSQSRTTPGTGTFAATGNYYYAISYHKLSTGALSNAALDVLANVAATTDNIVLSWGGGALTNLDATKYDYVYIYRSAVSGSSGFTTGTLIGTVASNVTTFTDTGIAVNTDNVPRNAYTVLDNTILPTTGTYKYLTTFKRRLVTANASTLYISELNKPESWPEHNIFDIPSGGPITALATITFISPSSSTQDEFLVVFKENELWIVTGTGTVTNSLPDWSLIKIDSTGCACHQTVVLANGYLFWVNYNGVYMWEGAGKPILISRPISELFESDSDLDRSVLSLAHGRYFKRQNQVVWFISHKAYGEQQYALKLDLRLTIPQASENLSSRIIDGVFVPDTFDFAVYSACTYRPSDESEETFILADDAGYIYRHLAVANDGGLGINWEYETPFLDQGKTVQRKVYHKVIAWVEQITTFDLTLDYWSDYRVGESYKSTVVGKAAANTDGSNALWDVAKYDIAYYDNYSSRPIPVVFNLPPGSGNTDGDSIRLKFKQLEADIPVLLYGFSIIYSVVGNIR